MPGNSQNQNPESLPNPPTRHWVPVPEDTADSPPPESQHALDYREQVTRENRQAQRIELRLVDQATLLVNNHFGM
jgi:hypothetical protein